MANKKAISPYTRLLNDARDFIHKAKRRKEINMFTGMDKDAHYDWDDVYYQMKAAEQLGYEVLIVPESGQGKFKIIYREKFPEIPYDFKY
ncbi:MAG: hypothetical protein KKH44_07685 [Bacteroidetes bacterium]|nr:hypothetical protein [Bacteroidota bacterium]